ncbi:DNA primase [Rhizobium sp. TH2]|uniref:DNA primase n=1 Tax=Rhizobium sp. TH2 TaxID=2775403 RepID=UPI0021584E81|nr:DNA primase [Rhizobium sp. TH2]UVC07008.1 DNA primase [Rhizobium sp. TH2]
MRFSNQFLDELRDRVTISDVIGRRVTWDRRKTNTGKGDYWACCPFHGEKSPSFHCEDRKGRYHCFGCGVSGDHFRFLMELDGLPFNEAVQQIADMAGVALPAPDPETERRERERHNLFDVMELATRFFQDQLQTAAGAKARAYLRDRGLTGRTIETFRLGYALESRNALKEHLASKGVSRDQIEACGLVVHENVPVSYDRFRDRIMFPILSSREKVIAFGGRALSSDAPAKYLNSNETELFSKGQVLYNFARARRASQGADGAGTIIAVEGYMDVIGLAQAGVENAVAPLGTALTENQLALLWKMTPVPVLCFDGDGAGMRAASRAVDLALPHLKPGQSLRIALLPDGKDPDDLVKIEGRAPFDKVIAEARALADMVWLRETSGATFDTPEKRAELEARLKQVTQVIGDESVRRHYQQDMRDRLYAFFQPSQQSRDARRPFTPRGQGQGQGRAPAANNPGRSAPISDRLARTGMVTGYGSLPSLRESVLALTIVNHPALFFEDYDTIRQIEFESRDMRRFWQAMMGIAAASGSDLTREELLTALETQGFDTLLAGLDKQIRFARLWTATEHAAIEDAREGYLQALSLHMRALALARQRREIERELADATERGAEREVEQLMLSLKEVQLEVARLENQEALVDGFGVMSGRVKGPAGGGH